MKQTKSSLFKKGEPVTLAIFPSMFAAVSGVVSVTYNHPRYKINYADGSIEEAVIETDDLSFHTNDSIFVATIQNAVKKGEMNIVK